LIAMGDTGQAYLKNALDLQQAMGGKTHVLAEGGTLVRENPLTGKTEIVAAGAPKREPVPSAIAEYKFAQDQGYKGTFQEFELAKRAAGAPKVAVDLKDPTAVAKAQSDVLKDWSGIVDKTGAREVADRFKAVAEGEKFDQGADRRVRAKVNTLWKSWSAPETTDAERSEMEKMYPDFPKLQGLLQSQENTIKQMRQALTAIERDPKASDEWKVELRNRTNKMEAFYRKQVVEQALKSGLRDVVVGVE